VSHPNRHNRRSRNQPRLPGVAPPDVLYEDYAALDAKTMLRCTAEVEELILMQSIEGHAHEGHGLFHGRKYPNTTIDDVARSLRLNPNDVKEERQLLIDEIREFAERAVAGEKLRYAVNTDGEPLLRCGSLRNVQIDSAGVMKGLYTGGLRDGAEARRLANLRYGIEMGYGECHLVDQEVLHRLGLDGFELARRGHEHELQRFRDAGLFAKNGDGHVAYMYVRYKEGPGASDDAALVMAGKLWGLSAAVGCFLADAVDTLEKYVPDYSDQDSEIAELVAKHVGLTIDDAVNLAYLCAIPEQMQGRLPDDSLRHMLQIDRKQDQCPLESHLAFVADGPYSRMVLDHGECTNVEFYDYIDRRMIDFKP
jgi:hypothetical protein